MKRQARDYSNHVPMKILAASVAAGTVIAANVLMLAAQPVDGPDEGALPARPVAITGIAAPTVRTGLGIEGIRLVVPVLDRPEVRLPALPDVEPGPWLGDAAMAAPTAVIDVQAPDIAVDALEAGLEAPALERPALPAPPDVR